MGLRKGGRNSEFLLESKAVVHPAQVLSASRQVFLIRASTPASCCRVLVGGGGDVVGAGQVLVGVGGEDLADEVAAFRVRSEHGLGLHARQHPVVPPGWK